MIISFADDRYRVMLKDQKNDYINASIIDVSKKSISRSEITHKGACGAIH